MAAGPALEGDVCCPDDGARVREQLPAHLPRCLQITCHVSPRVPATHLALLLLEVGPLLLLLGLQHHLGTRHLLALPRPAATIRYDDIRSGVRGPAPSGRQLVFAGEGIEDSVGPDILQAGLVLHRELVTGPASPHHHHHHQHHGASPRADDIDHGVVGEAVVADIRVIIRSLRVYPRGLREVDIQQRRGHCQDEDLKVKIACSSKSRIMCKKVNTL